MHRGAACAALLALGGIGCARPERAAPSGTPARAFVDAAESAGLRYRWTAPSRRPLTILETIGNGCAFLDFDRDGRLDILLVGSPCALFRGDGRGKFVDVGRETGIAGLRGRFLGCAVGDTDNDGFPDLYLCGYRAGKLLRNAGGKRFVDISAASGIPPQPWGTSAAFADIDNDGKLDLYVGNYVRFDESSIRFCKTGPVQTSCPPGVYDGVPGRLYRNAGGGRFVEATRAWGAHRSPGKTLGVAFADFDGSGRQSLALANDEVPGELFYNRGTRFEPIGPGAGIAFSNVGQPQAGMGQDWGDYDNDGRLDLTVMTFVTELKPIYHNDGGRIFSDQSAPLGTASEVTPYVAFGVKWLDADNDGWLDWMLTNGHTADNIADTGQGYSYRQPTLFFQNAQGKRFVRQRAPDLDRPLVGRGLATGDYDEDGRVDALAVDSEGAPLLLHNETPSAGHWLSLRLVGRKGNRDGYGARVTLEAGGQTRVRHCHADGSYLSSSDPRVHFGLGAATAVKKLEIRWPGGRLQRVPVPGIDRTLTVEEAP